MADLLDLSARIIDQGDLDEPSNRVNLELSEVAEGVGVVESFSHVWALRSDDGLLLADTSLAGLAPMARDALRRWSADRVAAIVYTHGHVDHVGGARTFVEEAAERGDPRPEVIGHRHVSDRFARYDLTNGYNAVINRRQFGRGGLAMSGDRFFDDWVRPDTTVDEQHRIEVGGLVVELHHDRGETDDHLWGWIPEHRAVLAGDFLAWVFPNAGNPQKVQRWPLEWAQAMRRMAELEPELLLPAHGLPIGGRERIAGVLGDVAESLESLVHQTLDRMNAGATLDEIIHEVRVPDHLVDRPYLQPVYDEPEFVVRNIWRLYGGWYDANPARLKPPRDAALAAEVAALAGGVEALVVRAEEVSVAGDHRLACQLAEWAVQADPFDARAHQARADVYRTRRQDETSLMAMGIFAAAAETSEDALESGP
jgi:alkyl sulfatase BDS1-like metallo-beta-lactamase superfamily hydrolase